MGDANADWLAYGLEDAFSEKPEIGVVRKHRTDSGLIHYDQRRDSEWPQIAREIIAAENPNIVVMMIGNNDRQAIREKVSKCGSPPLRPKRKQRPRSSANPNPGAPADRQARPRTAATRAIASSRRAT